MCMVYGVWCMPCMVLFMAWALKHVFSFNSTLKSKKEDKKRRICLNIGFSRITFLHYNAVVVVFFSYLTLCTVCMCPVHIMLSWSNNMFIQMQYRLYVDFEQNIICKSKLNEKCKHSFWTGLFVIAWYVFEIVTIRTNPNVVAAKQQNCCHWRNSMEFSIFNGAKL